MSRSHGCARCMERAWPCDAGRHFPRCSACIRNPGWGREQLPGVSASACRVVRGRRPTFWSREAFRPQGEPKPLLPSLPGVEDHTLPVEFRLQGRAHSACGQTFTPQPEQGVLFCSCLAHGLHLLHWPGYLKPWACPPLKYPTEERWVGLVLPVRNGLSPSCPPLWRKLTAELLKQPFPCWCLCASHLHFVSTCS